MASPSVPMARCSRRRVRTRRYACGRSAIQQPSPACCGAMTEEVWGVAFSPDGQVLATTSADQTVRLWSLSNPTAEPRVLRGHKEGVIGVAFSPDGQVLATTSADQTVRLWSLSNPTAEPRVLRGHEEGVLWRRLQSGWPGAGDGERGPDSTAVVAQQSNSRAPRAAGP